MITKEIKDLRTKCEPVETIKEGEEIGALLLDELSKSKKGIGLAANQIGINKRVCVVNVKQPIVLINPKIVQTSQEQFIFPEGCLSFPNKKVKTVRHVSVVVESDNCDGQMHFDAESDDVDDAFECACVQHEIDHLDGITMYERRAQPSTVINGVNAPKKYGRNEKVTITDGSETKVLKYKKALPLIDAGWEMSDIQINT